MGKTSREDQIVMKVTYEWEKLEFTPLYERICEQKVAKSRLDRLIRKVDAGLPTDSFISQGRTCDCL